MTNFLGNIGCETLRRGSAVVNVDGRTALIGDSDVKVFDHSSHPSLTLTTRGRAQAAGFASRANVLFTLEGSHTIKLWSGTDGHSVKVIHSDSKLRKAKIDPTGQVVAAFGDTNVIWLWHLESDEPPSSITWSRTKVAGIGFDHDGSRMVAIDEAEHIVVYPAKDKDLIDNARVLARRACQDYPGLDLCQPNR